MQSGKNFDGALSRIAARWEWGLVICLTPIILILTSHLLTGYIDPYDEGIHYLSYPLYRAGKVPYLDFYPLFPPIWTYTNIIIEKIFGEYLLVQRLWFVLQASLVVWACYAICKKIYSRRLVTLGIIVLIISFGFHPYWLPRWSGARLAVYIGFLLFYMSHVKKPEAGAYTRLFFLGLLTGLTNLYAFDVGIHITAASAAMVLITFFGTRADSRGKSLLKLAISLAGFLLPLVLWAAYLAYHGSLYGYISTYYYVYMFQLMPISSKILSVRSLRLGDIRLIMLFIFLVFLTAGLLYTVIYRGLIKRELTGQWSVLLMAMLLSFAVSVSTLRGIAGPQYLMFSLIPMLLWGGFAIVKLTSYLSTIISDRPCHGLRIPVAALLRVIMLILLAIPAYGISAQETRIKIAAARTNISIIRGLYQGDEWFKRHSSTEPQLAYIADNRFDNLIDYLRTHTRPDEAILAFPMYVEIIPALAGRHSATSYPIPILIMGNRRRQLEYIEEIKRTRPRYAVIAPAARFGGRGRIKPYLRPIYIYLRYHYRQAEDFPKDGYFQIWVKKGQQE